MLTVEWDVFLHSTFNTYHSTFLRTGAVAQLGEHLLCKQGVVGSIPISSTKGLSVGLPAIHAAECDRENQR
jgi:hypothetical protein